MGYCYTLASSIAQTNLDQWRQLRQGETDPFMDPRFIAAVERTMGGESRSWTVIVQDEEGRAAATACLSLLRVDGALLADVPTRAVVTRVRRLFPGFLRFNVLLLGLPVSASQSHLRVRGDADTGEVLRVLDAAAGQLARRHRAPLVVWKEFDLRESARLDGLAGLGYHRADSLPMNHLHTPYGCFGDFCGAMRSRYRRNVRGSLRKFGEAGLRVVHVTGREAAQWFVDDRLHRLYLAVLEHAGGFLEKLPPAFFRELFEQWGDQAVLTLVLQESRAVAWGCSLLCEPAFYMLVMGLDYGANSPGDVYFNLVFACLDYAMRRGASDVWVGANADQFKARLGCSQRPRCFYVKGRGWLGRLLPFASRWLFPAVPLRRPKRAVRRGEVGPAAPAVAGESTARCGSGAAAVGEEDAEP